MISCMRCQMRCVVTNKFGTPTQSDLQNDERIPKSWEKYFCVLESISDLLRSFIRGKIYKGWRIWEDCLSIFGPITMSDVYWAIWWIPSQRLLKDFLLLVISAILDCQSWAIIKTPSPCKYNGLLWCQLSRSLCFRFWSTDHIFVSGLPGLYSFHLLADNILHRRLQVFIALIFSQEVFHLTFHID